MNPPLVSVEAADWLVYADWAQDFMTQAVWSEDKARRIAFVLGHWYCYWGDVQQAHRHPNLWLRLSSWLSRTRQYTWSWAVEPTQAPAPLVAGGGKAHDRPEMDQFTNPAEAHLCLGNQWHAVKFFNYVLLPKVLDRVLKEDDRKTYETTFNRVHERNNLRHHVVTRGEGKYRRVHWVRGEYLEVFDLRETGRGVEGQAVLVEPCSPYHSSTPDSFRSDRPWPLLMRHNALQMTYNQRNEIDARGGIHDKRKARWRAHDWVKV
jgi:hypothetical protein